MIPRNVAEERLRFTTDLAAAVQQSDILFIAVGTPQDEDGSADLRHVLAVADGIGRAMNGYKVIVNKSTVPVGTDARRCARSSPRSRAHPFAVVSNPEFLKEGTAVDDFLKPDRVVIGADDAAARGGHDASSTRRSCAPATPSWSWTAPPPSSRSTRPTPCWPAASRS